VKRFRRSENHEIERELRKHRPEPRSAFVSALAAEVHGDTRHRPKLMPRLALAGALAVAMLTFFAVFGGAGYTASAVQSIDVSRLAQAVGKGNTGNGNSGNDNKGNNNAGNNNVGNGNQADNNKGNNNGPDEDQYKPGKGCGDKNHVHLRENECKDK
jgi:hypothetical protein